MSTTTTNTRMTSLRATGQIAGESRPRYVSRLVLERTLDESEITLQASTTEASSLDHITIGTVRTRPFKERLADIGTTGLQLGQNTIPLAYYDEEDRELGMVRFANDSGTIRMYVLPNDSPCIFADVDGVLALRHALGLSNN